MLAIGQLQPMKTWFSLLERSMYHAAKLDRAVAGSGGALVKVTDTGSLEALLRERSKAAARPPSARSSAPRGSTASRATSPTSTGFTAPGCGWRG
jgi:hypothetical protein